MVAKAGFVGEGLGLKVGGLIVEVVEVGVLLCVAGRSRDCEGSGAEGESGAGPSKGDGLAVRLRVSSSSSSKAGVALADAGGVSSFLPVELDWREGEAGTLSPLVGLAKGLDGRSAVCPICDGRRTNGLVFSGDNDPCLVGEKVLIPPLPVVLTGEVCVGVVARTVAGEALF